MKEKIHEELLDKAVYSAANFETKKDQGSSQISNFLNMMVSDRSQVGIKKLLLFIARQAGSGRDVIKPNSAKILVSNIQWILNQKDVDHVEMTIDYLTYLKWSFDALKGKENIKISNLNDLLKVTGGSS